MHLFSYKTIGGFDWDGEFYIPKVGIETMHNPLNKNFLQGWQSAKMCFCHFFWAVSNHGHMHEQSKNKN